ncbi:MAG: hypothetical protein IPQ25_19345 [Chitinophagaceae bacterium]|nr:hypothetical protein [Chitinophagaceae bacterium]HQV59280.1 DUF6263 family protein [Chitinophagaceae bacterium]HQV85811.1 DUF6263 family protein [Chitinophagaceae bacterium]HQX73515.1 DUF6263 family protein [Chitinophagaceae bacterium]HQZ75824.1 DUF6263 family protein [Chitinophagaceae bacterium]
MNKVKFSLLLVTAVAFSFIFCFSSCQSTRSATTSRMLKFNFEKGKGYDYEMNINMNQEIMGSPTKLDISTYYSMDVQEDDGTVKTLQTKYDRFKINMDVMGMQLDVDTDKPLPATGEEDMNPMSKVSKLFAAIKGQEFTMKVDAEGKILEVKGFKEMAESIVSSMDIDDKGGKEESEKMKKQFDQQFNDKNIREQFERVLYIFPNKEVKVGDSWEKSTNMAGQLTGKMNSTYTVTDIEGDMVTLEEKTKIGSAEEGAELEGEQNGILVVDSRTGLVVTADLVMNMTAKAGGIAIDINGKTKIKGKARQ